MIWNFIKNLFMPSRPPLNVYGRTDTGRKRPHNEDSFCILPEQHLFMVADGMGGHNAGEVASKWAIEALVAELADGKLARARNNREELRHLLVKSFHATNKRVIEGARKSEKLSGMGCTLITAYVHEKNILYTCHVGDVRGYVANPKSMTQITNDHTYFAEVAKKQNKTGEKPKDMPARNIVSRAVGFPFPEDPECHDYPVQPGDRVLLCSDGLWSMLPDKEIHRILFQYDTVDQICDYLIDHANQAGGKDNITAAVAFI